MDKKLFKDVFFDLRLDKKIEELIGNTEVEKITMFKSEKKMVISFVIGGKELGLFLEFFYLS